MRVIREAMLEAHQNVKKYGGVWHVVSDDFLSVVNESYFSEEEKCHKFKSIYNTFDRSYRLDDILIECFNDKIYMVEPEDCEIPEKYNYQKNVLEKIINHFTQNHLFESDLQEYYIDATGDYLFATVRFKEVENTIFKKMRELEVLKNFLSLDSSTVKNARTFHITEKEDDDLMYTFIADIEKVNVDLGELDNILKSITSIEKYQL